MPYFQRPTVDRGFRAFVAIPTLAPIPIPRVAEAAARPLVERIAAILAREPAVGADLFAGADAPGIACATPTSISPCPAPIDDVPLLPASQRGRAGQTIVVPLTLANDDAQVTLTLEFRATDLLSSAGDVVPAAAIGFAPARLALGAGAQETVRIAIAVPPGSRPGLYAGLVQTVGDPVRAVITLDIDA